MFAMHKINTLTEQGVLVATTGELVKVKNVLTKIDTTEACADDWAKRK